MKPGELTALGTLFMRASVYERRTSSGQVQYLFPLIERLAVGVKKFTGVWTGIEAETFVNSLRAQLKAGTALSLSAYDLYIEKNEIHFHLYTASIAPGRWESLTPKAGGAATAAEAQTEQAPA